MGHLLGLSLRCPIHLMGSAMTALCLDLVLEDCAGRDLHEWLGGAWALLFSNPEDFEPQGREKERWLASVRDEFAMRGVRVLAVKRDRGWTQPSWGSKSSFDPRPVQLCEPLFAAADEVSFAARVLRGELLTLRSRFVLLIDGSLQRRAVLKYGAGRCAASVLDLLAATAEPLSHLVRELPRYAMIKDQYPLAQNKAVGSSSSTGAPDIAALWDRIEAACPDARADRRDGLRLDWDDRWVHVRASNTEPIVRVIAEAPRREEAERLCREVGMLLRK